MKIIKLFILGILLFTFGCNENGYIEEIEPVEAGPDESPPAVDINFPNEGTQIRVKEDVTSIDIDFQVLDDIEIQSISVMLDGNEIATLNDFKDYRRVFEEVTYDELTNGSHTVTVSATDMAGKTTSETVEFEKIEPYIPMEGEIFYMPFDGNVLDLVSLNEGISAGNIGYVDGVSKQAISLDAGFETYVTYDSVNTISDVESFTLSFWVFPEFVDENGDGNIDGILGLVNLSNTEKFWGNIDFFVENGSNPTATTLKIHITNGDDETWITASDVANFFGNWSHHVLTYDASTSEFTYYKNGDMVTTTLASWDGAIDFQNSGPMVFGTVQFQTDPSLTSAADSQGWASYLTGELDEVRFFNMPLSEERVINSYQSEKP